MVMLVLDVGGGGVLVMMVSGDELVVVVVVCGVQGMVLLAGGVRGGAGSPKLI